MKIDTKITEKEKLDIYLQGMDDGYNVGFEAGVSRGIHLCRKTNTLKDVNMDLDLGEFK